MKISYGFTCIIMATLNLLLCFSVADGIFINKTYASKLKQVHNDRAENKIDRRIAKYLVQRGDSVYKLCHKYNLTPAEFYRINPLHSSTLVAGEEVFVPKTIHSRFQVKKLAKPAVYKQEVINYISTVASSVKAQQSSKGFINSAKLQAMAIGQTFASSALSNWFSRYGTARISLLSGGHFSSLTPEAELLLPLYDSKGLLIFTQDGIHSTEGRKQINLGVGGRYFMGSSMVGLNSFFDHDFSAGHSRVGFGVEYWRDYLKLIGNSYLRVSNWKKTLSLPGYEARPANGWDLRVNAYLPALPQLGAELGLEKYYGTKIGFAEKSDMQGDPYRVTLAVNYTPVPLVTFNAAYKRYQNSKNQMSLGMALNYKLGKSLSEQLNSSAVDKMRRLPNSRYDLVERNNDIVLEYRRASDFTLQLSRSTIDVPLLAERAVKVTKSLQLYAHSSSGFASTGPVLDLMADAYKKDGGSITIQNCTLASNIDASCEIVVSAPVGEIETRPTKEYLIKLTAKDSKNDSETAEFTVKVLADPKAYRFFNVNPEKVPIKVPPAAPQAFYSNLALIDRTKRVPVKLDLKLLDTHHRALTAADITFQLAPASSTYRDLSHNFKWDPAIEQEPGHYVSTLYANAKIFGDLDRVAYRIVPIINNEKDVSLAHTVNFIKIVDNIPNGEEGNSQLLVTPDKIAADGTSSATIKFIAKNAEQEVLPNLLDSLRLVIEGKDKMGHKVAANLYNYTSLSANDNVYTAELTSEVIASYNIKVQYRKPKLSVYQDIKGLPMAHVEAVSAIADQKNSSLTIEKDLIYDNGDKDYAATISAVLKDKNGRVLTKQKKVSFFDELDKVTVSMQEVGDGKYTAQYTSMHVGQHQLYLSPEPGLIFKDKGVVLLVEPSVPFGAKNISIPDPLRHANDEPYDPDNVAKIKLSAISEKAGVPLRYIKDRLRLHITGIQQIGSPPIAAQDIALEPSNQTSNIYTADFRSNIAGEYTAQLQYKGPNDSSFQDIPDLKIGLYLISDYNDPDQAKSNITFSSESIKIHEEAIMTLTLNDKHGNRIIGKNITSRLLKEMREPANPASYRLSSIEDVKNDGIYKATFQASERGQYTFDFLIDNNIHLFGIHGNVGIRVVAK